MSPAFFHQLALLPILSHNPVFCCNRRIFLILPVYKRVAVTTGRRTIRAFFSFSTMKYTHVWRWDTAFGRSGYLVEAVPSFDNGEVCTGGKDLAILDYDGECNPKAWLDGQPNERVTVHCLRAQTGHKILAKHVTLQLLNEPGRKRKPPGYYCAAKKPIELGPFASRKTTNRSSPNSSSEAGPIAPYFVSLSMPENTKKSTTLDKARASSTLTPLGASTVLKYSDSMVTPKNLS